MSPVVHLLHLQARAVWQWWNYLAASVPVGVRPLRLNLDETSVCLYQPSPRGIICVDRKRARMLTQPVPQVKRKRFLTYVSIISDCGAVQRNLPQFLIGNESVLRKSDMPELLSVIGPNVRLLRRKSAWVNQVVMAEILRELRRALAPFMKGYQPILSFDAAPQHTTPSVFRLARGLQIWPLTIPAKLTWLIQPLDTHVFASFKRRLEHIHQAACISAVRGDVTLAMFLQCVGAAIEDVVLHGSWAQAFGSDGFGHMQAGLSDRVRAELGLEGSATCPAACPTLEQVACCFPKRFRLTPEIAFGPAGRVARAKPLLLRARIPKSKPGSTSPVRIGR